MQAAKETATCIERCSLYFIYIVLRERRGGEKAIRMYKHSEA